MIPYCGCPLFIDNFVEIIGFCVFNISILRGKTNTLVVVFLFPFFSKRSSIGIVFHS